MLASGCVDCLETGGAGTMTDGIISSTRMTGTAAGQH